MKFLQRFPKHFFNIPETCQTKKLVNQGLDFDSFNFCVIDEKFKDEETCLKVFTAQSVYFYDELFETLPLKFHTPQFYFKILRKDLEWLYKIEDENVSSTFIF